MLERVTLGQTRFVTPGLAPDARGIATGRLALLRFATLEGVVTWLRLYTAEESLDELLPTLEIIRARPPLGSAAFLIQHAVASTYVLDRAARCARLAGGAAYTGTSRHFVRARDERSPYGYDVLDLGPAAAGAELVLHDDEGAHPIAREVPLDVAGLVHRLSLRRVPGGARLDPDARALLYVAAARGLAPGLVRYLLRGRVTAGLALVDVEERSAFAAPGEGDYVLARVRDLPARVLGALAGVPGIAIFRPVLEHVAVEVGWTHPITLSSVGALFPRDRFHLFRGAADRLDVLTSPPQFAAIEHLAEARLAPARREPAVRLARVAPAPRLVVDLRLIPASGVPRRVVGSLVAWHEAARLKKLVYTLPPVLLRGHQVALTERGIVLLAAREVDVVPLGTLLSEVTPGVLVPLGMDLAPRVATDALLAALAHEAAIVDVGEAHGPAASATAGVGAERLTIFPHEAAPFSVARAAFAPLERRVVAPIVVPEAPAQEPPAPVASVPPRVVNDPVGRFGLWGFPPARPR